VRPGIANVLAAASSSIFTMPFSIASELPALDLRVPALAAEEDIHERKHQLGSSTIKPVRAAARTDTDSGSLEASAC